ncbi:thiamine pyrophosphate-binding protein [Actinomadura rubrobrunea]|nr:thiamine pyrophosphate-binding protein [Actinomadura rubrobrunea]
MWGSRSVTLGVAAPARSRDLADRQHPAAAGAADSQPDQTLGPARRSGRPAAVVCTSGTAAADFHPAVIEAHQAGVPMIVLTADRPPELRDTGANQSIDQIKLYGTAARWSCELGAPGNRPGMAAHWRSVTSRAWALAQAPLDVTSAGTTPSPWNRLENFAEVMTGQSGGRRWRPRPRRRAEWHRGRPRPHLRCAVRDVLEDGLAW